MVSGENNSARMTDCCIQATASRQASIIATHSSISFLRHVIVGRNFGSYVTHETKHFIYFYLGQVAILLFKSG